VVLVASEQFSQAVRGSSAEPVGVAQTGSLETNDYDHGGAFDASGANLPTTVNPARTIQEVSFTATPDDGVAVITTVGGDQFDLALAGGTGTWDRWNIDSIELKSPSGGRIAGGWAGE
jgi:hypothetical protein